MKRSSTIGHYPAAPESPGYTVPVLSAGGLSLCEYYRASIGPRILNVCSRFPVLLATLAPGTVPSLAQTGLPDSCPNGSPLPFAAIEVKHPIDQSCGIHGKTTSPAASQLQNSVKNNFCAASATPETFTPQMLIDLQHKTQVPSGFGKEPTDRTPLKDLGEGKLIRMKGFLIEAHHADLPRAHSTGGGESVNCNALTEEGNDIHIALGAQPSAQECESISAEISPHYRPASWNEIGHFETWNPTTGKYLPNPAMASRLQAHAYRITGQLFFDSSHAPCPCRVTCSPVRATVWEIHPVHKIEVCEAGASCDENADGDWIDFDSWWKGLTPIQPSKRPHSHSRHEPATNP